MNIFNKEITSDESTKMTLTCLSVEASTLTNGHGNAWPEAWNPEYKVH